MGPAARRVGLAQLGLHPGQGLLQRLDQVLDLTATGIELAGRLRVRCIQPAFGNLQETPRTQVQGLRRQRLETLRELPVDQGGLLLRRALNQRGPVLRGPGPLIGGPGLARCFGGQARQAAPGVQVADHRAEDGARQESGKQQDRTHVWQCLQSRPTVSVATRPTRAATLPGSVTAMAPLLRNHSVGGPQAAQGRGSGRAIAPGI